MGDILSQSEIDELLRAMSGGGGDAVVPSVGIKKEAANYDFARPSKINKEQLRSLEIVYDSFSRALSSFLTGYLRTSVHVEVASAEQVTYSEFNNFLVNPVILTIMELPPLKGSLILELSANIGYAIIDRILGGPGTGIKKMRDFSEIEKILLERVVTQIINFLPDAWSNVEAVKPRIEKIETNSQFAQIISPNEMTALVTLTIKVGSVEGLMNFCIPYLVLEPVLERLNTKYWFAGTKSADDEQHSEELQAKLEQTNVEISAVIGKTRIMVSDFVNLQVGDIIPLDSYINSDLNVMVGSLLKFNAKPGVSRGKNAIQITSLVEKEE